MKAVIKISQNIVIFTYWNAFLIFEKKIYLHVKNNGYSIYLILVSKGSRQKVQQRVFKKDGSVFKEWKEDTPFMINQMLDDDLK